MNSSLVSAAESSLKPDEITQKVATISQQEIDKSGEANREKTSSPSTSTTTTTKTDGKCTSENDSHNNDDSSQRMDNVNRNPTNSIELDTDQSTNDKNTQKDEKPLSKSQMKKRKRLEKLMAIKKRKKQQAKEAKAAKAKAEGRDLEEERRIQAENAKLGVGHKKRELEWRKRFEASANSSFRVCIDCPYESSMTIKEIGSLSNQIRYCYSVNKKSKHPLHLSVSSLSGQTYENLCKVEGFPDNWKDRAFQCSEQSLTEMHTDKDKIVYLTSDSENVLHELDDSKIYVIGGIVDRNRLKCAAINKANELGVQTARLPIDEHLKLCSTKVLTCNHVFEILQKFKDHKDWKKALLEVLPARKDASSS